MNSDWSETGREREKKMGLRSKLTVQTLDIQIKRSRLKVSNCKVFCSENKSKSGFTMKILHGLDSKYKLHTSQK